MKRTIVYMLNSVFLLLSVVACNDIDSMNSNYDKQYEEAISSGETGTEVSDYNTGYYRFDILIPYDKYCIPQNAVRVINVKTGYKEYQYWLEDAAGTQLGAALIDDETGERQIIGNEAGEVTITATENKLTLLRSVTRKVTTEKRKEKDLSDDDAKKACTLICHAFNGFGDEYWDTAKIYVLSPLQEGDDEEEIGD